MDRLSIEIAASQTLNEIYSRYKYQIKEPLKMIDPYLGCQAEGFNVLQCESLGRFGEGRDRFEVAGALNRAEKKVLISNAFPYEVQRFTAAHELGHLKLHPDHIMHRDRPVNGWNKGLDTRPEKEKEADFFAACFLMPRDAVIAAFKWRFGAELPFTFDDDSSFWLARNDPHSLLYCDAASLDRALALATSESYKGRTFLSLKKLFNVSADSMAIRLTELKLIRWP